MHQKLLIVDDEPLLREILVSVLSGEGFLVEVAEDGQNAMTILSEQLNFAAVVSDVFMPNMDGIKLLEEVSTKFPKIPVFIMSGGLTIAEAKERLGKAAGYFEKPLDFDGLTNALKKIL